MTPSHQLSVIAGNGAGVLPTPGAARASALVPWGVAAMPASGEIVLTGPGDVMWLEPAITMIGAASITGTYAVGQHLYVHLGTVIVAPAAHPHYYYEWYGNGRPLHTGSGALETGSALYELSFFRGERISVAVAVTATGYRPLRLYIQGGTIQ